MRYGLVTGMGRSGSMWTAHALAAATDLDARHESVKSLGQFCTCPGRVEINTHWRYSLEGFRASFPRATIVHLVRDGRDVVRSAMSRKDWTFEAACDYWTEAVRLVREHADMTVRLEALTDPDTHSERVFLCSAFGVSYVPAKWAPLLSEPRNATGAHSFPHWRDWDQEHTDVFWERCRAEMEELGYGS